MTTITRYNLVEYWQLPTAWKRVARCNADNEYALTQYLQPQTYDNPDFNVLLSISEYVGVDDPDFDDTHRPRLDDITLDTLDKLAMDGVIILPDGSAMAIKVVDNGHAVDTWRI